MQSVRVLIVEDDPMVASINQRLVGRLPGFHPVGVCRTAREVLEAVQQLSPDLVLLDVYLPDQSGVEVLQSLRARGERVHVIPVTAAHDATTVEAAIRLGAVDYLFKPYEPSRLEAALLRFRAFYQTLKRHPHLNQADFDLLRTGTSASSGPQTPKGINQATLRRVLDHLARADSPVSATHLALAAGISRVTALRYLDYLLEAGHVEEENLYGAVGRPVRLFRLRRSP